MESLRILNGLIAKAACGVFGVVAIPKHEIRKFQGGEHVRPDENIMFLFSKVTIEGPVRNVLVIDARSLKTGEPRTLFEFCRPEQASQTVTVYLRVK